MLRKSLLLSTGSLLVPGRSSVYPIQRCMVLPKSRALSSHAVPNTVSNVKLNATVKPAKMPITILSGFLGAGKTTFLQKVLTHDHSKKFGLLVNDVASVNIDSKLIKKQTNSFDGVDTLELQNGCVCCTLADDTMLSISKLINLAYMRNVQYDHIIIECSGIAEPRKIRQNFHDIESGDSSAPTIFDSVKLDTLVTVIDANIFMKYFGTATTLNEKIELASNTGSIEGEAGMQGTQSRKITELLLEQVECADVVLINKCDLLTDPVRDVAFLRSLVSSINPSAKVLDCVRGALPDPLSIVGSCNGTGAADWGILEEHKLSVTSADKASIKAIDDPVYCQECNQPRSCTKDHVHGPDCGHSSQHATCTKDHVHGPDCGHSSQHATCTKDHVHGPDCGHISQHATCTKDHVHGPDCGHSSQHATCTKDHVHGPECGHSSQHATCTKDHVHGPDCGHSSQQSTCTKDHVHGPDCAHSSQHATCTKDHVHSPDCGHSSQHATCTKDHVHGPDCGHSHSNDDATTAETRFGITSFVYRRRRPFHPVRLTAALKDLGKLSVDGVDNLPASSYTPRAGDSSREGSSDLARIVLRSKGFVWIGSSQRAAYYMSHAGQHLELSVLGRWWAAADPKTWPENEELRAELQADFEGDHGDRRQEIVFIGLFGSDSAARERVEAVLDACLLTDLEFNQYKEACKVGGDKGLQVLYAKN